MSKKAVVLILAVTLAVVFGLAELVKMKKADGDSSTEGSTAEIATEVNLDEDKVFIFTGATCPACKALLKAIDEQGLREKIAIQEVEVFSNKGNQQYYLEAKERCGEAGGEQISVPLVFYQGECTGENVQVMEEKIKELIANN